MQCIHTHTHTLYSTSTWQPAVSSILAYWTVFSISSNTLILQVTGTDNSQWRRLTERKEKKEKMIFRRVDIKMLKLWNIWLTKLEMWLLWCITETLRVCLYQIVDHKLILKYFIHIAMLLSNFCIIIRLLCKYMHTHSGNKIPFIL